MFSAKIKSVAFVEHPATDLYARKAGMFDVLMNLNFQSDTGNQTPFPIDIYCAALLQKTGGIDNNQLKIFITYQQQLVINLVGWLTSLDELIVLNADIFDDKIALLKAEKTLFIIEFALNKLNTKPGTEMTVFDFQQVKMKLKSITTIEDQLVYLYNLRAEYLQSRDTPLDPDDIPFDEKIIIEINKINELQEALFQLKTRKGVKHQLAENYIDNEDFLRMMKISKRTAQTWRDNGIIAYSQIKNKIYYLMADVEALLKRYYMRSVKQ